MTELPISWLRRRELIAAGLGLAGSFIAQAQPARTSTPRRGGTLVVHMAQEQRMLNPALRASIGVYIIGSKIIEPLFDLGETGDLVARLGLGGSSSADGKSITVTLRSNVKWHDGKPFTSADVQFCAMELWKKYQNYGSQLHASLEAVDTPNSVTAVFRYSKPMPLALFLAAAPDLFYVVPKHIYEGSNPLENPANSAPIGTGPYKFAQYERGQFVVAGRNPDYWLRGMPYLDKIVWRFIADKAAAAAAIEAGQVHMSNYTGLPLADINRLSKDARFEVSSRGNERQPFQTTIQFNLRRKELADVRVRRAIIHAIDTDFFINNFLYGQGKRAAGPIPAGSSFFQAGAPDYPFNPARANALLDEAGFKPGADGSRFTLKMISPTFAEDVPLWCTYVQQALQQAAIKVEVQRVDMASYISLVYRDWNYDLAADWHIFRADPAISTMSWYRSGAAKGTAFTNQWGWMDPKADQLIDAAAVELSPAKRKLMYTDIVKVVNTEMPIWMAMDRQFISVTSKKVHNHHNNPRWPSSHWADVWVEG